MTCDSRSCCCFTKSYGRYAKGTGSLLATKVGLAYSWILQWSCRFNRPFSSMYLMSPSFKVCTCVVSDLIFIGISAEWKCTYPTRYPWCVKRGTHHKPRAPVLHPSRGEPVAYPSKFYFSEEDRKMILMALFIQLPVCCCIFQLGNVVGFVQLLITGRKVMCFFQFGNSPYILVFRIHGEAWDKP